MSVLRRIFIWKREPLRPVGLPEFQAESDQSVQKIESAGRALDRVVHEALGALEPRRRVRGH